MAVCRSQGKGGRGVGHCNASEQKGKEGVVVANETSDVQRGGGWDQGGGDRAGEGAGGEGLCGQERCRRRGALWRSLTGEGLR